MNNVLFERFLHDGARYDHFGYNQRYELTNATYRSPGSSPPATGRDNFVYDDIYNRKSAVFGDPFATLPAVTNTYAANLANEYTSITGSTNVFNLQHDRAGNMTYFPVLPATSQADVPATARWDAFNSLFDIENPATAKQHYRYDPFRRRIAVLNSETSPQGVAASFTRVGMRSRNASLILVPPWPTPRPPWNAFMSKDHRSTNTCWLPSTAMVTVNSAAPT